MTWADHYEASVFLEIPASEFWAMTPMEFDARCSARIKMQPGYAEPVTLQDFEHFDLDARDREFLLRIFGDP